MGVGLVIALGLAALPACAGDGGPRLAAVTPAAASRNATVMVTGSRLCGARADCASAAGEVDLGLEPPMVRAIVVGYSDTAAQIVVPAAAPVGATSLTVTVNERSSNALDFEVLP
ncbi:MAG TPA: hypothetical protein VF469_39690 [Kofleriaceae bacterium]